jgi:hypothetical protein
VDEANEGEVETAIRKENENKKELPIATRNLLVMSFIMVPSCPNVNIIVNLNEYLTS